jgi:hypothetical protein
MLHRLRIILLAAAVFAANAYCACVTGMGASSPCHAAAEEPEPHGCHGSGDADPMPAKDGHNCDHCNGTRSLDTPGGKTTLASPLVSTATWAGVAPAALVIEAGSWDHAIDHSGPSPPVSPPTLLNQFCSFNN